MHMRGTALFAMTVGIAAFVSVAVSAQEPVKRLPPALFDEDPVVRVEAIGMVEEEKEVAAVGKLASMARDDPFAEVREAACRALGALGALDQLALLDFLAVNDANAAVRTEALKASKILRGVPIEDDTAPIVRVEEATADPVEPVEDEDHKKPQLREKTEEVFTRHFAIGLGTMGGYGIAALNLRGRIPTGSSGLPWVGLEIGGGWSPPSGYAVISGLRDPVTDDAIRWRIISGGGGVLLFFHRSHYMPIRAGFDIGQGPYVLLGYGFEVLNEEGFFGWGGELGILYHPVMKDWVGKLVDGDPDNTEFWPVVPFARFVLHFYLV